MSGSCTLRQTGGFAYLSATFSWTPCRIVSGAPDAANASTELATCSASGWPLARTPASRFAMSSSPSIVSQMQHRASSGPASWSAAAAASVPTHCQSARAGSGPCPIENRNTRACRAACGRASSPAISRQAGHPSSPVISASSSATHAQPGRHVLGGGQDLPDRVRGVPCVQPALGEGLPLVRGDVRCSLYEFFGRQPRLERNWEHLRQAACHPLAQRRDGRRVACCEAAPGREDRTEPAVPLRKREEVQEVLRCPRVGMSRQVRPARFAGPSQHSPAAAGRGCGVPWGGL